MSTNPRQGGFTLIELMVVVLIIAIVAAFGIPQYLRAVETTKADEAVSIIRSIAAANRMATMDLNTTTYRAGQITSSGPDCNTGSCPTTGPANGCDLVVCKYLSGQDWNTRPYDYYAANGNSTTSCGGKTFSARNWVACAGRKSTALTPYSTWGFAVDTNGGVEPTGTTPPSVTGF